MYKNKIIPYLLTITSLSASGTVILDTNPFNQSREVELSPIVVPQIPMRVKQDSGTPPSIPETQTTSKYLDREARDVRDAYVRNKVSDIPTQISEAKKNYERAILISNILVICSTLSTACILVITIIGASKYIDPSASNVTASIISAGNIVFIWGTSQYKRVANGHQKTINQLEEMLLVPGRFSTHDESTSLEPLTTR